MFGDCCVTKTTNEGRKRSLLQLLLSLPRHHATSAADWARGRPGSLVSAVQVTDFPGNPARIVQDAPIGETYLIWWVNAGR
jgi:hypothetical protein